jgi:hypothetical protein
MRRLFVSGLFVTGLAALLWTPAVARALRVAVPPAPPGPQRVVHADTVIVGRVAALEDKDVEVEIPGTTQKAKYRIAIVNLAEGIKGAKDMKSVRVAFIPPPAGQPGQPIRPIRPGLPQRVELKVGMEGLLFLTKHAKESFYLVPNYYDVVSREAPTFKKDLDEAKQAAKLLENPMAGLKSKDAKERFLTASLLITMYRGRRSGAVKTEPIDAEESKLILMALADGDWKQPAGRFDQNGPMTLFNQLGVTPNDGFRPPQKITSPQDYPNAVRTWLKENAGKFRIQRFVGGTPIQTGLNPSILPYIEPVERPPIRRNDQ